MAEFEDYDITTKIGPLHPIHTTENPPEWPMYSFDRPSVFLWNAIGKNLTARGWKEKRVKEWLQSVQPRWALDRELGEALEKLGKTYAEQIVKENP
jgi:hypothetical protein